jgi:diaminopimelate decarboxylase
MVFLISRMTCDIYGSSGDDMDILVQDYILDQSVSEGDWLHFGNMGAFSYGLESNMASTALPPYKFR